jgi:hypothetical protein
MTLQRQTISVPLGSGQSDDASRPLVDGNETSRNFTFPKTGQATKRPPPVAMNTTGLSTAALNSVVDVGGIPAILDNDGSATWNQIGGSWVRTNATAPVPALALIDPLVRGANMCGAPSIAILGNVLCCVWGPMAGRVGVDVPLAAFFDITGGSLVMVSPPLPIVGFDSDVKCVAIDSGDANARIVVVGNFGNFFRFASWLPTSGVYSFGTATDSGAGAVFTPNTPFDLVATSSAAFACAYLGSTATSLLKISSAGAATLKATSVGVTVDTLCVDPALGRVIGFGADFYSTASGLGFITVFAQDFGGGWFIGSWTSVAGVGRHKSVGQWNSTDFIFLHSRPMSSSPTALSNPWGCKIEVRGPSGLTLSTGFLPNVSVCSAPYLQTSTGAVLVLLKEFEKPYMYLARLVSTNGVIHARKVAAVSQAALLNQPIISGAAFPPYSSTGGNGTRIVPDVDGVLFTAFPVATSANGAVGINFQPRIDIARVNTDSPPPLRTINVADLALSASAFGVQTLEPTYCASIGMNQTPNARITAEEVPGIGALSADPGAPAGTDSLTFWFAWVWIDMQGNQRRAAPSDAIQTITNSLNTGVTTTPNNKPVMVVVPLPPIHETFLKEAGIELYLDLFTSLPNDASVIRWVKRFKPLQSPGTYDDCIVGYFGASATPPTLPNVTAFGPLRMFTDNSGDFSELAWWESELEPTPPPATLDLVSWQSRAWALSAVNRNTVVATKPIQFGSAPEFAAELEVVIPDEGGPCVAIAALDDKVIIFKERKIYVVSGDPGDSLGNNSTLQKPRMVSGDVGCICAQSVVEGPFGVAFQSQRGFYTLSRGLELAFVGDKVQDLTADDGTLRFCGALSPRESVVRWTAARSSWAAVWEPLNYGLAWDYIRGQWSHWTAYDARHHAVVDGVMHRVSNTQVIKETLPGDYSTSESLVALKSPWLKVNGIAGFQRVWRVTLVARHYTGHIRASVFYDYEDNSAESVIWTQADIVALRGSLPFVTLSLRPQRQKCQAIQVQFEELILTPGDNPVPATTGQGFEPVSIDLEVGTKSGTYRRVLSASAKR